MELKRGLQTLEWAAIEALECGLAEEALIARNIGDDAYSGKLEWKWIVDKILWRVAFPLVDPKTMKSQIMT